MTPRNSLTPDAEGSGPAPRPATPVRVGLDPALELALRELDSDSPADMEPADARRWVHNLCRFQGVPPALARVERLRIPTRHGEMDACLYAGDPNSPRSAAVIFFHGGGWMLGDVAFADVPVRTLAARSGLVWISAEYPLAPEHPFPAAVEGALDVMAWVEQRSATLGIDRGRLAVAGESSGANVAAALCIARRDAGAALPAAQFLFMPPLDLDFETAS